MSKIEVDAIEPQSGTSLTLGASGDTITIPSGATITNSGTATGFGTNTPAFFARKTSNQNITDATVIKCTFDSEDYDVGSCFDLGNSKFVVPSSQAGKYIFYGGLDMNANANQQLGAAIVYIYKNGSIVSDFIADYTTNPISQFNYLWKDSFDLLAADYIEIYAYIDDTSGTPTINSDSTKHRTFFGGYKIIE